MLVSIRKPVTEEHLRGTLEEGATLARCRYEDLKINPVSSAAYRELQNFMRNVPDDPNSESRGDNGQSGAVSIRQVPSHDLVWEFQLKEKGALLSELKVKYENKSETVERTYTPAKFEDYTAPLSMTRPGHYALRLEQGMQPISYSLSLTNLKGEALAPVKDQPWPMEDQFYLVLMKGFQGSRTDLFETVRRKKNPQVANPIDVEFGREMQFSFGSIGGTLPSGGPVLTPKKFTAQVPWLGEERTVRRVWIYFPLTKENQAATWGNYNKLGGTALSERIRGEKPAFAEGDNVESLTLAAESQPRWIELAPQADGRYFSRDIAIQDFDKVAAAFPEVWWLICWEFDNGATPPSAILSESEHDKRPYTVVPQAVPLWQRRVQSLLNQPKANTEKATPDGAK